MKRDEMADLTAFVVVAEERSFTKAAAKLGMSQSSLSQIVRRVETRLGLRLLTRTTRSVAPTEAGERLLRTMVPALNELDASLAALSSQQDKPAGTVRITSVEHAAKTVIWPALKKLLPNYPEITVEISLDYDLVDIVAERFDAGVRLGEQVDKDMIAVRIAPDMPMSVVGAPSYFANHPAPKTPQTLVQHACLSLRLPTSGGLYAWPFKKGSRELNVHVQGPLVFNTIDLILDAAINGFGLAYLPTDLVEQHIKDGRLIGVLDDWCRRLSGYHLYYPNRKPPAAFALLVEALRYKP
jgi:LysR family transcriptional regulator, regulator of peptidoglycan recycling